MIYFSVNLHRKKKKNTEAHISLFLLLQKPRKTIFNFYFCQTNQKPSKFNI